MSSKLNITSKEVTLKHSALNFRTEYTEAALRRTVPIENSAPDGYMRIIQALVRASGKNEKDLLDISQIKSRFIESDKEAKNIMDNIAQLSNQPFPIITSEKIVNELTGKMVKASLVNPLTGKPIGERYARVKLSRLGRLLTRHYRDVKVGDLDHYDSIVPLSLLRESTPWATGYKGQMLPLNPKELFQLMVKMIDYNSPMVEDQDLTDIFRGFDVGDNYSIYMRSDSLISLYAMGEASCVVMPEIEIDRANGNIIFLTHPFASSGEAVSEYLVDRLVNNKSYGSFTYSPTITVEGKKIRLRVTNFKGADEDIFKELYKDRKITKTLYLRHNIIRQRTAEEIEEVNKTSLGHNPYDFELDVMPVYETLWDCIQKELNAKIYSKKLELADLKEKLKWELLLEKVTRPEVAKIINELNQYRDDKISRLLKICHKGSEVLPEGITTEEAKIVYEKGSNIILGKLFHREEFEHLYINTQKEIDALQHEIDTPTIIMQEIKSELIEEINSGEYERKSKVYFANEESAVKAIRMEPKPRWDEEDLPCTIYYDWENLRRGFGRNLYFNDFAPTMSLNTTTHSKIMYMYRDLDGNEQCDIMEVRAIPTTYSAKHKGLFRGIVPVELGRDMLVWTSESRFKIIEGVLTSPLNFNEMEYIRGWIYKDKSVPYIDLRVVVNGKNAIQRVWEYEFKHFKNLKTTWDNIGSIYDMMPRSEDDEFIYLMKGTVKDKHKFDRVLLKSRQAHPIPIEDTFFYFFSPHMERYVDNIYLWKWSDAMICLEHHMTPHKNLILKEHAFLNLKDKTSKSIKDSLAMRVAKSRIKTNMGDISDRFVVSRTTDAHRYFDITSIELNKSDIDPRLIINK